MSKPKKPVWRKPPAPKAKAHFLMDISEETDFKVLYGKLSGYVKEYGEDNLVIHEQGYGYPQPNLYYVEPIDQAAYEAKVAEAKANFEKRLAEWEKDTEEYERAVFEDISKRRGWR